MDQSKDCKCSIFDEDAFTLYDLVEHLVKSRNFICCNGKIYFYDAGKGIHILLPEHEIWFYICRFISREVTNELEPKDIRKLISMLKLNVELHVEKDRFNSNQNLINIKNGVYNLTDGTIIPKRYDYYFTSYIDAEFYEEATLDDCPTFKMFCNTSLCGDEKSIRLLLQIIGYLCCGYSCAKKAFMLIGEKNCGKSKILEFIQLLLGEDNVCNIPLHKLGNRFNVAELSRHKANIQAELSLEPLKEIETFKNAVGGDRLCGEDKGEPLFYFENKCKLVFAGNGIPALKTQDTTLAFVSRLVFLIFPKEIPENDRDTELVEKLYAERDIIFSLAMVELNKLIENGFKFEAPELSAKYMKNYSEQNNQISEFINDRCVFGVDNKVFSRDLYHAYKEFCTENCFFAHSEFAFFNAITGLKNIKHDRISMGGKRLRGFIGISLKN